MRLGIKNKWALVTGGANGIGEQISLDLAKNGVNLIITSRENKNLENKPQFLEFIPDKTDIKQTTCLNIKTVEITGSTIFKQEQLQERL